MCVSVNPNADPNDGVFSGCIAGATFMLVVVAIAIFCAQHIRLVW